ncbi:2-aminoadipate transaminase [Dirofilaria immitis]
MFVQLWRVNRWKLAGLLLYRGTTLMLNVDENAGDMNEAEQPAVSTLALLPASEDAKRLFLMPIVKSKYG